MQWPEEQLGAKCSECPLLGQPIVPPEAATSGKARIYLVGDSPGGVEVRKSRPFVGEAGALVNDLLSWQELDRSALHLTHATLCPIPPGTSKSNIREAMRCCSPRLQNELAHAPIGSLVLAMGSRAMETLTGATSSKAWRGYPLPTPYPYMVFPTFSPHFILQSPAYLPVLKIDLDRALRMHRGEIKPWVWPELEIEESDDAARILEEIMAVGWVGVDVETAGEDPYSAPLLCVGLAHEHAAVSLRWPILDKSLEQAVRYILKNPKIKKVYQNGNYDLLSLKAWGLENSGNDFDTLVAHRILAPQIAHDLGFIASCEFAAPRWKSEYRITDDGKGASIFAKAAADTGRFAELRTYNAKDAIVSAMLRPVLEARLDRCP